MKIKFPLSLIDYSFHRIQSINKDRNPVANFSRARIARVSGKKGGESWQSWLCIISIKKEEKKHKKKKKKNYGMEYRWKRQSLSPFEFEISEIQVIITPDYGELHSLLRP